MVVKGLEVMDLKDQLAIYVTEQFPFGPVDSARIDLDHRLAWQHLFDPQNRVHDGFAKRPQIVVGRRGSGKTALLQSAAVDASIDIRVSLNAPQTFEAVIARVDGTTKQWLVESIAELWDVLLRSAIYLQLSRQFPGERELAGVRDFVGKLGIESDTSIDAGLWSILNAVSEKMAASSVGMVASVIKQVVGTHFAEARDEATAFMERRNLRAVVLVDSLDGYELHTREFKKSLAGLLRCAGQFSPGRDRCDIRFCLPAELYAEIVMDVSAAPVKDFANRMFIRWEPHELLAIAAHRIKAFLTVFFPAMSAHAEKLSADRHSDAEKLFEMVFPPEIKNRLQQRERTLTYVLRHTQLLPRHVLLFMNSIARLHLSRSRSDFHDSGNIAITPDLVVNGIEEEEHTLVAEVFSGYRPRYPWLADACDRLLPNISTMLPANAMHKAFNRHARAAKGIPDDYFSFQRALLEAGIIGLHTSTKAKYEEADFEYTVPEQLKSGSEQIFCLHPLFSRIYRCQHPTPSKPRAVYPRGTSWFDND